MTTSTQTSKSAELPLARTTLPLLRRYLGGRRALIVLALAAIGVGVYFGSGWLAAVGVAPLLVALAPCAAMCALGLCASKMGGKSCSADSSKTAAEKNPGG